MFLCFKDAFVNLNVLRFLCQSHYDRLICLLKCFCIKMICRLHESNFVTFTLEKKKRFSQSSFQYLEHFPDPQGFPLLGQLEVFPPQPLERLQLWSQKMEPQLLEALWGWARAPEPAQMPSLQLSWLLIS